MIFTSGSENRDTSRFVLKNWDILINWDEWQVWREKCSLQALSLAELPHVSSQNNLLCNFISQALVGISNLINKKNPFSL